MRKNCYSFQLIEPVRSEPWFDLVYPIQHLLLVFAVAVLCKPLRSRGMARNTCLSVQALCSDELFVIVFIVGTDISRVPRELSSSDVLAQQSRIVTMSVLCKTVQMSKLSILSKLCLVLYFGKVCLGHDEWVDACLVGSHAHKHVFL